MHTGLIELTLSIPVCFSLKEKRSMLLPIRKKIENRFQVSMALRGLQDYQQEILVCAMVSKQKDFIEKTFSQIIQLIEQGGELEVIDIQKEFFFWQN